MVPATTDYHSFALSPFSVFPPPSPSFRLISVALDFCLVDSASRLDLLLVLLVWISALLPVAYCLRSVSSVSRLDISVPETVRWADT